MACLTCADKEPDQYPDIAELPVAPAHQVRIPTGDEIKVDAEVIDSNRILVTVTNLSTTEVFLPYLPGISSDIAFYAHVGLEKFNAKTGNFEAFEGGDFGTGSNALKPGASFRYGLVLLTNETYRLNIRYIIDEGLSERKNRLERAYHFDDKWRQEASDVDEEIKVAVRTITTEPIRLFEKPKP